MTGDLCIHEQLLVTCTTCNGRDAAERKRARQVEARWPARYTSRLACGHTPEPGDIIARLVNGDIVCTDCPP